MDHADANHVGVRRRSKNLPNAACEQLTLVRTKDAFEDPDERRFSSAVLPDQCKNFAGIYRKRHVL
jgi:hypothetical protein